MLNLQMKTLPYQKGQLFLHQDGGFYKFDKVILSASDQSTLVVYEHLWPFEPSSWGRNIEEFEANFKPTTKEVYRASCDRVREEVQKEVQEHKAARRAKRDALK